MKAPLYRRVADRLAHAIRSGTYRPGDKLPSVRGLARDWDLGINTVIEAYRGLELDGLVAARPQAGFYVALTQPLAVPTSSQPPQDPTPITIGELALRIHTDGRPAGVVNLGAAFPDAGKLPQTELARIMRRLLADEPDVQFAYTSVQGTVDFRTAVAKHWLQAGCALHPDEIVATAGGLEAMVLALRATCATGDVIAVESPTYYGVLQALEGLGLRAIEVPSSPVTGMDLGALRWLLGEHQVAAVLAIPNFCNPSGSLMPDLAKRELALVFCAGGRWSQQIQRLKAATSIAAPTLAQHAVAQFLTSGAYDRHMRSVRPLYARTTLAMAQAVAAHFPTGTRVSRPQGGYVLWVELPAGIDALQLYELALRAKISIAPGPLFSPRGRFGTCIRLNATGWDERRQTAIATLARLATKLAHHAGRS